MNIAINYMYIEFLKLRVKINKTIKVFKAICNKKTKRNKMIRKIRLQGKFF